MVQALTVAVWLCQLPLSVRENQSKGFRKKVYGIPLRPASIIFSAARELGEGVTET